MSVSYIDVQITYASSLVDEYGRPFSKDLQKYFLAQVIYDLFCQDKLVLTVVPPNFLFVLVESLGFKFINGLWYNKEDSPYGGIK